MKLLKKYKGDSEKEFETTLEKELIHLAKAFINVELIVENLKKGDTVYTPWAQYRMVEEESDEKA